MAVDFSELTGYISQSNHTAFLRAYITFIVQGESLAVPKSLKTHEVSRSWKEIFDEIQLPYTDDFVEKLSHYWILIVKKQGGKVTENFAKDLLQIIENKRQSSSPSSSEKESTTSQVSGSKDTVESTISSDYYQTKKVTDHLPRKIKDIRKRMDSEFKKGNHKAFLIVYLSFSRFNQKVALPLSTVKDIICKQWNVIFSSELKLELDETFIEKLSSIWFQITNKYGIPLTVEDQQKIYYDLIPELTKVKKSSVKEKPKEKKKKSFFQELFGL